MSALAAIIQTVPGGDVCVSVRPWQQHLCIDIEASGGAGHPELPEDGMLVEGLQMARQLVELLGAKWEVASSTEGRGHLGVRIAVPMAERRPVLVIDDNADALTLYERCLDGFVWLRRSGRRSSSSTLCCPASMAGSCWHA